MTSEVIINKCQYLPRYLLCICMFLVFSTPAFAQGEEFKLGTGDVIKIEVFEQPELTTTAKVSITGNVVMPLVGAIKASGLTTQQTEKTIAKSLTQGGFVKRPQVVVTLIQVHSQQVSVLGHVVKPGKFPIEGPTTLIDLLASAGGLNDDASQVVLVIRSEKGKKSTMKIDTGEFFSGEVASNISLKGGDIVLVPKMEVFYIYGEVRRPGAYRLEHGMSVVQGLSVGGGLTERGTLKGIHIKRKGDKNQTRDFTADLNDIITTNDVVYVKESFF